MAYIEGLCKNCGSLIQVNPAQSEARCIFCWDKTDSNTAVDLLNSGSTTKFPNEKISDAPPFEERMNYWRQEVGDNSPLKKAVKPKHNYDNIARKEEKKNDGLSAVSRLKMMKFDLLQVPKVSLKNRILLALGLVILPVSLLVALTLPKYIQASSVSVSLQARMGEIVQPNLLAEGRTTSDCVAILNNDISSLRVVVKTVPEEAELKTMAKNLYKVCAEITKSEPTQVNLQVISRDKSYAVQASGADNVIISELTRTR